MVAKTILSVLIVAGFIFAGDNNGIVWKNPVNFLVLGKQDSNTTILALKKADNHFSIEEKQKKNPGLAFGMSLILPGSGQYYNGNYWRTALYSGIEILSWTMYAIYNGKGDDEDAVFRKYADQHWSEYLYWAKVYQLGVSGGEINDAGQGWNLDEISQPGVFPGWTNDFTDYYKSHILFQDDLRDKETSVAVNFTHSLPLTKTQQYYEMIGKYSSQFGNAWDDADFNRKYLYGEGSPNNKEYYDMRNLSNDYYDIAGYWVSVVLINHLASGLDALWSSKAINRSLKLAYKPRFIDGKLINTYALNFEF